MEPRRYRRTARGLGRLAGRWSEARVERHLGLTRRSLHYLFFGKVVNVDLPILATAATWDDSAIRAATAIDADLREDLQWLAGTVPELLDRAEMVPHGLVHGDAAPENFHETVDGTVVALDWGDGSSGPMGSDLAQLLAGRFESGSAMATDLPAIADTLLGAYTEGLADENQHPTPAELRVAWATHLAVRSAFSALLVDRPDFNDHDRSDLVLHRAALARYAVDLARSV